ncbi:thialysine N-epsilon-acetyltransferase isoform X1 [Daphnia magna]|uniref:thialysine N-epsilon-acetyltransferase isoform X1 n=1 Tax=Daphnia magna TaxID=35525 RepID=UPI0006DFA3C2|nr:thialysine N-epsilon-acetyltransferase isoform X1 [Daphnia magna]XP_032784279.1 thialysine N-epsilon-acetyltransferase isoform X1 [Daphnia magna]XP_032784280.1 thialysine N-epsilon-acetyltransferase isoform X1 [Daphnia magna]XP_045028214.1 thialysine N-epsilon-acetyltransferase isoform X1 [Daphnia magna]
MDHDKYAVRKAIKEDCESIQRLIQELADYEKMPNGPQLDPKTLEQDGFGTRPFFEAFVAVEKESNQIIGFALYFFTYSTWQGKSLYMEDIYVQLQHRRKGVGLSLLRSVSQVALSENCVRLNFSVLNWNSPSIEFYKSLGASDLTEKEGWHCFRMNRAEIEQLAQCKA